MTIFELGALGEFLGSLLMLGTLVYLAFQVQQAKELVKTSIALERGAASREINGYLLTSPDLNRMHFEKYKHDGAVETKELGAIMSKLECTGEDAQRISSWLYIAVRAIEVSFITEGDTERSRLSVVNVLATSVDRIWWSHCSKRYSPTFSQFVDSAISQTKK